MQKIEDMASGLFIKEDGNQVCFFLHKSIKDAAREAVAKKIESHYGLISDNPDGADVVLVRHEYFESTKIKYARNPIIARTKIWVEPVEFVGACIKRGVYQHIAPAKTLISGRPPDLERVEYTAEDDENLCVYIASVIPYKLDGGRTGTTIYKDLYNLYDPVQHPEYDWVRRHSAQSWRERYKTNQQALDVRIEEIVQERKPLSRNTYAKSRNVLSLRNFKRNPRVVVKDSDESDEELYDSNNEKSPKIEKTTHHDKIEGRVAPSIVPAQVSATKSTKERNEDAREEEEEEDNTLPVDNAVDVSTVGVENILAPDATLVNRFSPSLEKAKTHPPLFLSPIIPSSLPVSPISRQEAPPQLQLPIASTSREGQSSPVRTQKMEVFVTPRHLLRRSLKKTPSLSDQFIQGVKDGWNPPATPMERPSKRQRTTQGPVVANSRKRSIRKQIIPQSPDESSDEEVIDQPYRNTRSRSRSVEPASIKPSKSIQPNLPTLPESSEDEAAVMETLFMQTDEMTRTAPVAAVDSSTQSRKRPSSEMDDGAGLDSDDAQTHQLIRGTSNLPPSSPPPLRTPRHSFASASAKLKSIRVMQMSSTPSATSESLRKVSLAANEHRETSENSSVDSFPLNKTRAKSKLKELKTKERDTPYKLLPGTRAAIIHERPQ